MEGRENTTRTPNNGARKPSNESERNPIQVDQNDAANRSNIDNENDEVSSVNQSVPAATGDAVPAELLMPVANVTRIMRKVLPLQAKISDDAKDTMMDYVSRFISYVTAEANRRCHSARRKTITPEDLISALGSLGFADYVAPLSRFMQLQRQYERAGRGSPVLVTVAQARSLAGQPLSGAVVAPLRPHTYSIVTPRTGAGFGYVGDGGSVSGEAPPIGYLDTSGSSSGGARGGDGAAVPPAYEVRGYEWGSRSGFDPYHRYNS
ncbi:uncharacterized protein LOC144713507 [Wolffia australiana]